MQQILMLVVAAVIGGVIWKFRADAASERKVVLARLATEKEERGDYSPLAEVFREAGVRPEQLEADLLAAPSPILQAERPAAGSESDSSESEPSESAAPDPEAAAPESEVTPEPTAQRASNADLRTVLKGMKLPVGLALFGTSTTRRIVLVTEAPASVVRAGIEDELERIGCSLTWTQPTVLDVSRDNDRARLTIYADADRATSSDGSMLFTGIGADRCAVLAEMV